MNMELNQELQVGQNIINAFKVVLKTYENLEKLWVELDEVAMGDGYFTITPKFLRWKSDAVSSGWLTGNFIRLYQSTSSPEIDPTHSLRNGPIYGVEIAFTEQDDHVPMITVAKYEYGDEIISWGRTRAVSEHWGFYHPLHNTQLFSIVSQGELVTSSPKKHKISQDYWGLKQVTFCRQELVPIRTKEQIKLQIVDVFMNL